MSDLLQSNTVQSKSKGYNPAERAFWRSFPNHLNDLNSSLQITTGAVVCVEADIRGDVKIGTKTIVHPCAQILATKGPIVIGDGNLIEELSVIENNSTEVMHIGNYNVFEVGSVVKAKGVGDNNVFEIKSYIGENVSISNGCLISSGTRLTDCEEKMADNSVYYGDPLRHRIAAEKPAAQTQQIEFLGRVLPNYHHVKTASTTK